MSTIRATAVAGLFYPDDPQELRQQISGFLAHAASAGPQPKAIVVPHAGYVYSGLVAGTAYARLQPFAKEITRVVLLGPSHRVPLRGLAAPSVDFFATPLGNIPVDRAALNLIADLPFIRTFDQAHALEHSIEVQLPFLQQVLAHFTLVPLVAGETSPKNVAQVLERLWGGDETLIVISSDLSHYHDYATAQRLDRATSAAIEQLQFEKINYDDACGRSPLNGLLYLARQRHLHAQTIDLRNSGDTAGPRDRVVGYGAYVIA